MGYCDRLMAENSTEEAAPKVAAGDLEPGINDYENGQAATVFTDDGAGIVYYPSGKAAIVISVVNAYQKRYYFYHNDRNNTMLAAIDERMVGFAMEWVKGKHRDKLILTKDGVNICNEGGDITQHWKWDRTRQNPGTHPEEPVQLQLNRELKFIFRTIDDVTVKFFCEGVQKEYAVGLRLKRTDCYLEHTKTISSGEERGKKVFDEAVLKTIQSTAHAASLEKTKCTLSSACEVQNAEIAELIKGHTDYFAAFKERHK